MPEFDLILMSLVIFLPSVFALGLLFFPRGWDESMRWWALFGTALTLGASLALFVFFKADTLDRTGALINPTSVNRERSSLAHRTKEADFAKTGAPGLSDDWVARTPWIPRFGIDYYIGIDGISMALILLTTVLTFLSMAASWGIKRFVRGYCMLFLILETGMLGTFFALDFFLFYIFWEVMLFPMYFLIGIWGGENRAYAAIKFFLYTLLGSVFILVALLAFFFTNLRDFVSQARLQAAIEANDQPLLNLEKQRYTDARKSADNLNNTYMREQTAASDARNALQKVNDEQKKTDELIKAEKDDKAKVGLEDQLKKLKAQAADLTKAQQGSEGKLLTRQIARDRADLQKKKTLNAIPVTINSFDLMLLTRAGKAALHHLNKQEGLPPVPALVEAQTDLERQKKLVETLKAKGADAASSLKTAEELVNQATANLKAVETGVQQRLSQPFFQGWFQYTMFAFLFIGFAIKVPLFPFHTWLPDAHVQAPTPISMILAGVLLKLGGYGIIRICYPICPWAGQELAWWIGLLGVTNIVYGAFAAMAQADFKKLVAYSSVSHMGYVILGIAVWSAADRSQYWAWGMNGAMFQMIAHGITSAGMFFLVGVIYDRAHHRRLDSFGGLHEPMPLYAGVSAVIFFAAMGLPGMCGFVGEFMVVLGAWNFSIPFAILSALTVVLTAAYILWTLQRVFLGTNPNYKTLPDLNLREFAIIGILLVLSVLLGIWPGFFVLNWMEPSVTGLVDSLVSNVR